MAVYPVRGVVPPVDVVSESRAAEIITLPDVITITLMLPVPVVGCVVVETGNVTVNSFCVPDVTFTV